jgi:hypothetical protein
LLKREENHLPSQSSALKAFRTNQKFWNNLSLKIAFEKPKESMISKK